MSKKNNSILLSCAIGALIASNASANVWPLDRDAELVEGPAACSALVAEAIRSPELQEYRSRVEEAGRLHHARLIEGLDQFKAEITPELRAQVSLRFQVLKEGGQIKHKWSEISDPLAEAGWNGPEAVRALPRARRLLQEVRQWRQIILNEMGEGRNLAVACPMHDPSYFAQRNDNELHSIINAGLEPLGCISDVFNLELRGLLNPVLTSFLERRLGMVSPTIPTPVVPTQDWSMAFEVVNEESAYEIPKNIQFRLIRVNVPVAEAAYIAGPNAPKTWYTIASSMDFFAPESPYITEVTDVLSWSNSLSPTLPRFPVEAGNLAMNFFSVTRPEVWSPRGSNEVMLENLHCVDLLGPAEFTRIAESIR